MTMPGPLEPVAPLAEPVHLIQKGLYLARLARTPEDLAAAQRLRWQCFGTPAGAFDDGTGRDADRLDDLCRHLLIQDRLTGRLVSCLRFLPLSGRRDIARSYSAQFHDLAPLESFDMPMIEIGRFCVAPGLCDPDIIRTAWAALTRIVEETGARMLFGCASFPGTDPAAHADAFSLLYSEYLAPRRWRPRIRVPGAYPLSRAAASDPPDPRLAMGGIPPLLRSYLAMGARVGDHAVIDPGLNTLHVFTAIEIRSIPPARNRLLHAATR